MRLLYQRKVTLYQSADGTQSRVFCSDPFSLQDVDDVVLRITVTGNSGAIEPALLVSFHESTDGKDWIDRSRTSFLEGELGIVERREKTYSRAIGRIRCHQGESPELNARADVEMHVWG